MVFILEKHTFSRQSTRQDTRIAVIFLLPTRASMLSWVKKGRKNLQKQTKRYPTNNLKDWNACLGIKSRENLRYIEYNQNGCKLKFYETDFVTYVDVLHIEKS